MLHVVVGNDFEKIKKVTDKHVGKLERVLFSSDDMAYDTIDSHISSSGLFNEPQAIVLKDVLAEHLEFILDRAEAMSSSDNVFILIEPKILKKERTKLEKHAKSYSEYAITEKKLQDNSLFNLADLLGKKDKKNLWLGFRQAIEDGKQAEEIHGILWWQIKTLLLIQGSDSNPGLHPFVFNKNKKAAENFSVRELRDLAKNLVEVYHKARMGEVEMEVGIEKFILQF